MPVVDHSHRSECESCRALHVWREKSRDLEKRLEIAEKAALACPKPLVWTSEPPKVPGWYWYRHKPSRTIAMINIDVDPTEYESLPGQWAGPIPEPREPK